MTRALVVAGALAIAPAALGQNIRAEQIATASSPVAGVAAPGHPGRLYIVEQNGRIRMLTLGPNTFDPIPFLDIGPNGLGLTSASGERGLLGLDFHPQYQSNGYLFTNYTRASDGATVISRWTADPPFATTTTVDPNSEVIIRVIAQDFANHNGGDLHFGPDGYLYVGMGDGGDANDPNERAQDEQSLLGKMLRLDVDNPGGAYIPPNNPYVGDPAILDEIWAFGLRNPFRFSFDRLTGDLYIGDVGQDAREEIDFQPALLPDNSNIGVVGGRNYGWDCREGFIASPASGDDCTRPPYVDPIIDHAHAIGCSITGGRVYRGAAIPELDGVYLYADYCGNWIRSFKQVGGVATDQRDLSEIFSNARTGVVAFGEDNAGELYIIRLGGPILKIVPISGPCGCPCVLAGDEGIVFEDTFTADLGWAVSGVAAGAWVRAVPQNQTNYAYDPVTDGDGVSAPCFVTGNAPASTDIDGGSTTVTSPPLDLTVRAITICYQYYLNMQSPSAGDGIVAQVSSSGAAGPWTTVATHSVSNGLAWTRHAITQADLAGAGVALTSDMRIRFVATDTGSDTTVEAGIDNVRFYSANIPDCNGNGIDDAIDIAGSFSQDCNGNDIPDECDIEALVEADCAGGPVGAWAGGSAIFNASCVGCHNLNGLGATGPNIRNKPQSTIKARLTFEVFHPGGIFPNLDDQDFADIEAFLADGSSRARPDGIPDSCETGASLGDCDGDTIPDACELEAGTQADLNYDGIPDSCQPFCPGDVTGDLVTNIGDFNVLASNFGGAYPLRRIDGDLTGDGLVNIADFNVLAGDFGCDEN